MPSKEKLALQARTILARLREVITERHDTAEAADVIRRRMWTERVQRQRRFLDRLKP